MTLFASKLLTKLILLLPSSMLLSGIAFADTKLMGFYFADDSACFASGKSLNRWKLARYQAEASGIISYMRLHIPTTRAVPPGGVNSTDNCTNDTVCWVIYDDSSDGLDPPNPGVLKAYGCIVGYNWDTCGGTCSDGVGEYHNFPVTNTVTNLSIESGANYFIGIYAYALHQDLYANAGEGCQQIHMHRGRDECNPSKKRFCSDGSCGGGFNCNEGAGDLPDVPDNPQCFNGNDIGSFYDLSIWDNGGATTTTTSVITSTTTAPASTTTTTTTVEDTTPPSSPTGFNIVD
jgi:hypothetical protein